MTDQPAESVVGPDGEDDFHLADHVWIDTPDDAPPYAAVWDEVPD